MTGETFTAEQLIDAANIILQTLPLVCDCPICSQERQWADMLTYAAGLRVERDALIASVNMLCGEIDRVRDPFEADGENTDR